jgi:hypothetical protein
MGETMEHGRKVLGLPAAWMLNPIGLIARAAWPGGRGRPATLALVFAVTLAAGASEPRLPGEQLQAQEARAHGFTLPAQCRDVRRADLPEPPLPEVAFVTEELDQIYQAATSSPGRWVDLTTLEWETATSGWTPLADFHMPRRGMAFPNQPITVNGQVFTSGIGTYPFSEVIYRLGGAYGGLRGQVALDDWAPPVGSARFSIYIDDVLVFRSPVMVQGQGPTAFAVPLMGASQLRLVVDDADGNPSGDYADWIGLEVFQGTGAAAVRAADRARLAAARNRSTPESPAVAVRAYGLTSAESEARINEVWFDEAGCRIIISNGYAQATFGYGGSQHGQLSLFPADGSLPALVGAVGEVHLVPGDKLSLADTRPADGFGWEASPVADALGDGQRVRVSLRAPHGDLVYGEIVLYDEGFLTFQIRPGGSLRARGYEFLGGNARALVGENPRFLSDRGRLWRGRVAPDGMERDGHLEPGKPFLLWSEETGHGIVMATIDESQAPMEYSLSRQPGVSGADLGLRLRFLPIEQQPLGAQASPRLWIQLVDARHVLDAFFGYRTVMQRLYPSAPLPSWVRYQWNSWWVYGPTPTEERLRRQIDFIAANLGDLGPWSLVVDAVWHVAYGRPTADLRNVDYEKFPNGIRGLSDYAHSQGISVVLFMSSGFVHIGEEEGGEWLALRGLIEEHPDWLIPLFDRGNHRAYMLNYAHPGVKGYMEAVVDDFVHKYGVDGVQLDGLADPEGQFTDVRTRDLAAGPEPYLPAMAIYRLVANRLFAQRPDAYLESGWVNPVFAHPYAHSFWWADDEPAFDNAYPFPGLSQQIDYALFQRVALGQRAKLAHTMGDPNRRDTRRWFEAALAAGAQVSASFDLAALQPSTLSALRAVLAHYRPFEGRTISSSHRRPSAFATTRDHMTYLGVLNRSSRPATFADEIGELGVLAPGSMAYEVESGRWLSFDAVLSAQIPARSFRLFVIPHQPRIVWSNASWTYERADDNSLAATLQGPAALSGFAEIWAPEATTVLLDGVPLQRGARADAGRYTYDPRTGVVRLSLTYDAPHYLEVFW